METDLCLSVGDGVRSTDTEKALKNSHNATNLAPAGAVAIFCSGDDIDANNSSHQRDTFNDKSSCSLTFLERPVSEGNGIASS
jgi:hypothetical protein